MDAPARERPAAPRRFALFDYGFRPFFLLAGISALGVIALWLWMYPRGWTPLPHVPPQMWHAHEMIYGFVAAAIAGFLLTAVPSWTGARGFAGAPLMGLAALWIVGRAAFAAGSLLPTWVLAALELSFLPALAALLRRRCYARAIAIRRCFSCSACCGSRTWHSWSPPRTSRCWQRSVRFEWRSI